MFFNRTVKACTANAGFKQLPFSAINWTPCRSDSNRLRRLQYSQQRTSLPRETIHHWMSLSVKTWRWFWKDPSSTWTLTPLSPLGFGPKSLLYIRIHATTWAQARSTLDRLQIYSFKLVRFLQHCSPWPCSFLSGRTGSLVRGRCQRVKRFVLRLIFKGHTETAAAALPHGGVHGGTALHCRGAGFDPQTCCCY